MKASHVVRVGDAIALSRDGVVFECTVAAIPLRRGAAGAAARCYAESDASRVRREEHAARMKLAAGLVAAPAGRPGKHARRALRELRGRR